MPLASAERRSAARAAAPLPYPAPLPPSLPQEGGLEGLKLYGMVGVPGEGEADVDATIDMMQRLKKAAPKLRLTLGCSTFVPKAHTPFQWYGVSSGEAQGGGCAWRVPCRRAAGTPQSLRHSAAF